MRFFSAIRAVQRILSEPERRSTALSLVRSAYQQDGLRGTYALLSRRLARVAPPEQKPQVVSDGMRGIDDYVAAIRHNHQAHPVWHEDRAPEPYAPEQARAAGNHLRFIAYYLPQYHPLAVNDATWGKGFTEWTNVTRGLPQYVGHYQPHLPADLGFYDLRIEEVMRDQIAMAKHHGVEGFCFHYYWFDGKKVMDHPLNTLVANAALDVSFCICWANENWTRAWDGMESEVVLAQNYSPGSCLAFFDDVLPIIKDPRYITVDGKPLLIIYRPSLIPDIAKVVAAWRARATEAGLPGIWLVCAQTFGAFNPLPMGFDAAVEFPPHKINGRISPIPAPFPLWNAKFTGGIWSYADAVSEAKTREKTPYPLYRCAFPSWDNEARRSERGHSFLDANPADFAEWLATCGSHARQTLPPASQFVFLNAWNEWAEGAHLEPDRHFGFAWLNKVKAQAQQPHDLPALVYGVQDSTGGAHTHHRVAVVLHIFYPETLPDFMDALSRMPAPFDLIVTTTSELGHQISSALRARGMAGEIHIVENRGRDIRPFISVLPLLLQRGYEAVLKLHSKKSLHRIDGDVWRHQLLAALLPKSADILRILKALQDYPALGIVAPEGNALSVDRYIGSNRPWISRLVRELGEKDFWPDHHQPWFPAGSMFWFKPVAVQPLLQCEALQSDAFEQESGQTDGTLAHAIERMLGAAGLSRGFHMADVPSAIALGAPASTARLSAEQAWASDWGLKGRRRIIDSPFARPTGA